MSKNKTELHVKGLHAPRFSIWIRGFLHGKIIHTGGLDPKTETISSGYVTGQTKRFRNACVARREKAEAKLTRAWTEADQLLIEFAAVSAEITDADSGQPVQNETREELRNSERSARKQAARVADRQTILKNMSNIRNAILAEYTSAHDQMEATSESLLSTFSCYGHGLMMKPVFENQLPEVIFEDCAEQIIANHEDTWNAMKSILKEVKE